MPRMFALYGELSFVESEISLTSTHSKHQMDSLLELFDFSDVALAPDDKIDKEEETLTVREDHDISDIFNQAEQIAAEEEELQDLNSESIAEFQSDWGNFGERQATERPLWNNGNTTDTAFKVGLNEQEKETVKFDNIIEPLKGTGSKKHKFKCIKQIFSSSCNSKSHVVACRFSCNICDKIYISSAWLKRHKRTKHAPPIGQNKKRKFITKPFTSHLEFLERRVKARIEQESDHPSESAETVLGNKGDTTRAQSEPRLISTHAQERVRVQYPDWLMTYAV